MDAPVNAAPPLADSARLVVKIGSALLVDGDGALRRDWLDTLAEDLAALRAEGREVVVASSGAVALGRRRLGLLRGDLRLEEKQAAAAIGQVTLAVAWQAALERHGIVAAQVLVTPADTEERRRHLNARNTILQLLKLGVVPVVNENDTVATEEIRYGDNDRLAARVAVMVSADTVILLSDIDGLYTADPRRDPEARHLPEVAALTPDIEKMAGDAPEGVSTGGMKTKLMAARIALAGGCRMVIAHGAAPHPVRRLREGERCTWFRAPVKPRTARKRWIAGMIRTRGVLTIDAGAEQALMNGRSLLPAGVTQAQGKFERGDPVILQAADGRRLGTGLAARSSADALRMLGLKSADIRKTLGPEGRLELVHRDDMALDGGLDAG